MMRPLDPIEWLHAQRLTALAAGDHAGFDHATALLDTLGELPRMTELEEIIGHGAPVDDYHDPLLARAVLLVDTRDTTLGVLERAGVIATTDTPTPVELLRLLEMFVPGAE
jgi:hypothetical protein